MATDDSQNNFDEKSRHHAAALGIGLICLLVGVPLWWKTTQVYRVSLPYSDIDALSQAKIEYANEVEVIWASVKRSDSFLSQLATKLKYKLDVPIHSKLSPKYLVSTREAIQTEMDTIGKATSLSQLGDALPDNSLTQYRVVVVDKSPLVAQPVFTAHNNIFLAYNMAEVESLSNQIEELVRIVVRETTLKKTVDNAQGAAEQKMDKNSMRSVRFHSSYDLAFTLIVPEPDTMAVRWDIQQGINDYLSGLIKSLESYTTLSASSQVLYLAGIKGKPKKKEGYFYLQEKDLPHIINPLESKLGSHASNSPTLNFIVYIPTSGQSPLLVLDKSDSKVPTNSFLSPRWGGVLIYNWDQTAVSSNRSNESNQRVSLEVDMHAVMEVFVTQTRLLLDIPLTGPTDEIKTVESGSSELSQWEVAGWLRTRCVENIATVSNTLKSLAQLLEEINNIVINDDIGKQVQMAVDSLKQSHANLAAGQLKEAFLSSRAALEASEKAFFHPSLLENLYFPEDQKFAIYIPLFLPISIPIVSSVLQAIKWFRNNKQKAD